jgi:hypothetical protein
MEFILNKMRKSSRVGQHENGFERVLVGMGGI